MNMHNFTPEFLADRIGELSDKVKEINSELEPLKEEAKRLGFDFAQGDKWRIDIDRGTQKRLDTKALCEKHPKIAARFYREIPTCTLRPKKLFQPEVVG